MGCSFARSQSNEIHSRVFRVYNVDDQGAELSPGRIEVGETDLILYQKGKDPIKWPLRCLRRYGFDAELFSFESGRRCPTGPGIYAFKSRNAEALFNMVQECILRAGQDDTSRISHNIFTGNGRQTSRPHSLTEVQETYGSMLSGRNSYTGSIGMGPLYVNSDVINSRNSHEYMNTGTVTLVGSNGINSLDQTSALIDFLHNPNLAQPVEPQVNYAVLDLPRSNENINEAGRLVSETNSGGGYLVGPEDVTFTSLDSDVFLDGTEACPEYMNIGPDGIQSGETRLRRDHNYANISGCGAILPVNNNNNNSDVNYIQLDLKNRTSEGMTLTPSCVTSFSQFTESPRKKTESYAQIDFKRMAALENTARTMDLSGGPNVRKTRHNSTIGDIS